MLIEQQNAKGGLLGRKLEPVVVDPASNWPLFAERRASSSRRTRSRPCSAAGLGQPQVGAARSQGAQQHLFYPVQYEGEESERNVFYTAPPRTSRRSRAVDYLMSKDGGEAKRWVLAGTDYVYPRTTNKILEAYLISKGVAPADIMINYTPFGHSDWQRRSCRTSRSSAPPQEDRRRLDHQRRRERAVLQGARQPGHQGDRHPASPSRSARKSLPASTPIRWSAISRPGTTSSPSRTRRTRPSSRPGRPSRRRQGRHQRPDGSPCHRLRDVGPCRHQGRHGRCRQGHRHRCSGIEAPNLTGGVSKMQPNHHITNQAVLIGEVRADGPFRQWCGRTKDLCRGDA